MHLQRDQNTVLLHDRLAFYSRTCQLSITSPREKRSFTTLFHWFLTVPLLLQMPAFQISLAFYSRTCQLSYCFPGPSTATAVSHRNRY